jgi:hypothetical protein
MMGCKARDFAPIERVTLEGLVARDHCYRQLERALDLGFVRGLVAPYYAAGGRPSIDPVVFFTMHAGDYPYWDDLSHRGARDGDRSHAPVPRPDLPVPGHHRQTAPGARLRGLAGAGDRAAHPA